MFMKNYIAIAKYVSSAIGMVSYFMTLAAAVYIMHVPAILLLCMTPTFIAISAYAVTKREQEKQ